MTRSPKWAIVAVDLDGTLIRGTTASLHLGDWLGHRPVIEELERRFTAGEIDSAAVADGDAPFYMGRTIDQIAAVMASAPCIDDIHDGVERLNERGVSAVICTVAWSFAAQSLADHFGFAGVSGTAMRVGDDGKLSGQITKYFEPSDKVEYLRELCAAKGVSMDQVVAIGDGQSDIPMFRTVGYSVALNASPEARAAASTAVDSPSFVDALRCVPGLLHDRDPVP